MTHTQKALRIYLEKSVHTKKEIKIKMCAYVFVVLHCVVQTIEEKKNSKVLPELQTIIAK